jgi:hypothetical protein
MTEAKMEAPLVTYKEVPYGYWTQWVEPAWRAVSRWRERRKAEAASLSREIAAGLHLKFDPLTRPHDAERPPVLRLR